MNASLVDGVARKYRSVNAVTPSPIVGAIARQLAEGSKFDLPSRMTSQQANRNLERRRMDLLELPLVLMDATLHDTGYEGLEGLCLTELLVPPDADTLTALRMTPLSVVILLDLLDLGLDDEPTEVGPR